jgi:hypothetical protein
MACDARAIHERWRADVPAHVPPART